MRLTPRAHEIQRVVDLLEDPTFESPEQMAKAVIKEVAELVQMRDLFAMVHIWADGSKGLNFGPFGSTAECEAFAKKMSFGGTGRVVPLTSSGIALANAEGKDNYPGYCYQAGCGHAPWTHAVDGASRGKCHLETCGCTKFLKDDPNKKAKKKAPAKKGTAKSINEL
ncbi:hypothetical protein PQC18_gp57 [Streptomyces phage Pablito]|uniref:Uncharacterized protein n=1 Tax=Streptomyces phage Pablito TaxID=2894593 RepID=A0AAE8YFH8_9CAUD|nr:hypothetical protein PQC18_gp57 [Streptomyces phage Pablito]UFD97995.1 hypothetical protein [Streptomyces phage Pablito]